MLFLRLLPLILCFSGLVHAEHRVFTRKDGFSVLIRTACW